MLKNPAFPWVIVVLSIIMAVSFSVKADRATERALTAEAELTRRTGLRLEAEDYAPAIFVKLAGDTLYYRVPLTVQVGGESFLSYEEKFSTIAEDLKVIGVEGKDGIDALRMVTQGTNIRYSETISDAGASTVGVVLVIL